MNLSVRELKRQENEMVVNYFIDADAEYLLGMGALKSKLSSREDWLKKLENESNKSIKEKEYYYLIWLVDGHPVGHSNINFIEYGKTAKVHLHLWQPKQREKGLGEAFLRKSIPFYFEKFQLETLICELYTKNLAPNKLIPKVGFEFVKKYKTIPGMINFHQQVNRYAFSRSKYLDEI